METDGWGAHAGEGGRARDRRKDAYLANLGSRVHHLTSRRFRSKPAAAIAEIAAALAVR